MNKNEEQQHIEAVPNIVSMDGFPIDGNRQESTDPMIDEDYDNRPLTDVELIQEHCTELFSMRDFVMEPQVITTLLAFFQAGGQPERVIDLLSRNYHGLGQYANLLGSWLADLEMDVDNETMETVALSVATTSSEQSTHSESVSNTTEVQRKIELSPLVRECFEQTINEMIKKQFSPDAVDKIFESDDSTEGIDWLPELISHRPWRRLIYELAEQFPNCLMLNFAVKLISDAGFQHEISNVNTAAQQLDIFSRVFLSSVDHLMDEWAKSFGDCQTSAYQRAFEELKRVVGHSEQTFLYTQMLLNHLGWKKELNNADDKKAIVCASLAQQLRLAFKEKKQDISPVYIGMIQSCVDRISPEIIQAVLTMMAKGLNPADIAQLYQAYSGEKPPPIVLIRDPFFTEMLIDALFNANGAKIQEEHRQKYIYLLAYACSVAEVKDQKGEKIQNKHILQSTQEQIQKLLDILFSPEDLVIYFEPLLEMIRIPILSGAILHYLRTLLLKEDLLSEATTMHFVLVDQITQTHPNLHTRVVKLLCELYDHQSNRNTEVAEIVMERQRQIVDRFVHLLYCGMAIPVLEKISSMFSVGHIDVSLVRYFGVEVLDQVGPPYSAVFVASFLPIVTNKEVFDCATLQKHPTAREFLHHCNIITSPPLKKSA